MPRWGIRLATTTLACWICAAARAQAPAAQPVPPQPAPAPCTAPEFGQFDFWVGTWEVTTPDGKPAGTNVVEKILGGCVIQENWQGTQGGSGKSFNIFFTGDGQWHQTWVSNTGTLLKMSGGLRTGRMVLSGSTPARDGRMLLDETSWEALADGTVRQHWRRSVDQGRTWSDVFIGIYRRKQ